MGRGMVGAGTFSFAVPATAVGQRLLVELVEWTDPLDVGAVGRPLPTVVRAGQGPSGRPSVPTTWPVALAVAAFGVVAWRLRRTAVGPEVPRVMPFG